MPLAPAAVKTYSIHMTDTTKTTLEHALAKVQELERLLALLENAIHEKNRQLAELEAIIDRVEGAAGLHARLSALSSKVGT
jgi:predicted RNase H-like nuclease